MRIIKIARRFQLKNQKAIFPPGLFHRIYVSIGIQYRGGILNFWKDGFELQVTILEGGSVKEYLLQVVFRCYEDDKYFDVFINTKNTSKGSSVVFDTLQSIKGIIDKFCMESTSYNEVHIELKEYGLHPEHSDYEPLSIARIKEEYSLPDRSLHVNNNPFYFGVENCSTDGIRSFHPYYIAENMQRLTFSESLLVNNFEEVREEKREELFKLSETFSTITTSAAITDQDLLMKEMMVMTSIESL
jgi:hypothetical protein